jgi:hypothetical protein
MIVTIIVIIIIIILVDKQAELLCLSCYAPSGGSEVQPL